MYLNRLGKCSQETPGGQWGHETEKGRRPATTAAPESWGGRGAVNSPALHTYCGHHQGESPQGKNWEGQQPEEDQSAVAGAAEAYGALTASAASIYYIPGATVQ